ncbi:ABC transporter substrate-binding protein, partial [Spirulina sp. 06S082]|uniref:ABC transporter substrate-binding protein n=1 Tax=Spirulina sp. 06S082 TaxID=3110248 RepID=UPI002B2056C3
QDICASSALGILGHYTGAMSLKAGEVYQKCGIPAITGSATVDSVTDNNPWYFRTIFKNSDQARFIAHYVQSVFKSKNVYLVTGDDPYSKTLGEELKTYFIAFGEKLNFIGSQELNDDISRTVDSIVFHLLKLKKAGQEPDLIIIAMQEFEAAKLIRKMRRNGINSSIVGGDSIGNVSFAQSFADATEEQSTPGFFTDDIHAVVPAILDISGEEGEKFKNEFELRYGYTPGWLPIFYHDSAHVLVKAIKNAITAHENSSQKRFNIKDIATMRRQVRDALTKINSPEKAVEGVTRTFYFNDQRNTQPLVLMGIFNQNQFISALTQLTLIKDGTIINDLEEELEQDNLIQISSDSYLEKTHIVYTGIDINEVTHIDEKNSSFLLDFYLWFRYKGDIEPDDIEFTNYSVERLDSGEKLTLDEPIKRDRHDGVNHVVYRVKADFHEKFDFHHYPFDDQILSIRFRHHTLGQEKLIYVVDFVGMRDTNTEEVIKNFKSNKVFEKITDWRINNALFFQDTHINQSTLGDRRLIKAKSQFQYSQFNAEIEIERDIISFSLKNLLPLWFFVVIAYGLLFLPFENISVEAISGLLLAVVFYHLSLLDSLPEGIGYVVALDYAFYLIYILLVIELTLIILGSSTWLKANTNVTNKQLLQFGRVTLPIL